jgi:hypothetical protein
MYLAVYTIRLRRLRVFSIIIPILLLVEIIVSLTGILP